MVATDTVVGIVGSVILVAVMAGVFFYEYNNAPEAGGSVGGADAFEEAHPGLRATEDIDGDGTANYADDDFDGDGVPNAEDPDARVSQDASGALGPSTPAAAAREEHAVNVSAGALHLEAYVNYTTFLPGPAPPTPAFSVSLVDENGESVAEGTGTQSGTSRSILLVAEEGDLAAGAYRLVVTQPAPGPGGTYTGTVSIHYGA